jgi:hypothetical protein
MRAIIVGVLLCALGYPALAATVDVTWQNPTSYTDGSALAASAITRTRIEYGTCVSGAFGVKGGEFISTGNDTTEVSPNLAPGVYCLRAYTTASGVESAASNIASVTVVQPAPRPPTLLQALVAWLRGVFSRFA